MKNILFFFFFMSGMNAWSQSEDSIASVMRDLLVAREAFGVQKTFLEHKSGTTIQMIAVADSTFNQMLVKLDSLTGDAIKLEKNGRLTSLEKQNLEILKMQQKHLQKELVDLENMKTEFQEVHDQVLMKLKKAGDLITALVEKMKELENRRQ